VSVFETNSNYWQITGVCLNVGDSAIDFPHESYGETLAKCQRYYQKNFSLYNEDGNNGFIAMFPVIMRASPSATRTGTAVTSQENVPSQVTPSERRLYVYNATLPTGGTFTLDAEL
jgi:hypothetical protein